MKKALALALALSAVIIFTAPAFAGSGSAIVPRIVKNYVAGVSDVETDIYVTNISNTTVTVKITLYDSDGTIYDESTEPTVTNFVSSSDNHFDGDPLSETGATLEPNELGILYLDDVGGLLLGYAVIEWETAGHESVALMATSGQHHYIAQGTSGISRAIIPVNGGKPF